MFQLAAFVMMVYDHLITFSDELQYVWKQPLSGATVLFAINRYITPLKFVVEIAAFDSPTWSKNNSACQHFVRYEGGATLALIAICEIIMMLRVYAIWGRDRRILGVLGFLWITQVAFCAMAMVFTQRTPLPPALVGCILTGDSHKSSYFTPFWVMPLITDSAIFFLTVWRTQRYLRRTEGEMRLLRVLQRDGALYFLCIFSANLVYVILYLSAPEDLKAFGAGFSHIITCVMISRLVINLRSHVHLSQPCRIAPASPHDDTFSRGTATYQRKTFVETIIRDLSERSNEDRFTTNRIMEDGNTTKMQEFS